MVFSVFLCRKVAALTILAYSPVDSPVYTQDSRTVLDLKHSSFYITIGRYLQIACEEFS
jgi:hypothetical protein